MIRRILEEGRETKVYTCYAYSIILGGRVLDSGWGGTTAQSEGEPVDEHTLFDLASLTKPILTATIMAQLVWEGSVGLDQNVSRWLEAFRSRPADSPVGRLLNHTSGLPAHLHLYRWAKTVDEAVAYIASLEPQYPAGTKEVYSDLGYIVLGKLIEKVTGQALEEAGKKRVFEPAHMGETTFRPSPEKHVIALTERYTDRPHGPGLVHDENCFFLGGICGHAGLFSSLRDIEKYALRLLKRDRRLFSDLSYRLFLDRSNIAIGGEHSYGWFIRSPHSSFFVEGFGHNSIGHTGFTGTGFWFDLERDFCTILLTNRVYFGRDPEGIRRIRARFNREALSYVAK